MDNCLIISYFCLHEKQTNDPQLSAIKGIIFSVMEKMHQRVRLQKKKFILTTFLLFVSIKGKLNFLQLGRYGPHPESLFRYHFEAHLDFLNFNTLLVKQQELPIAAIAFDPTYLSKSGKQTPGVGYFWSGVAQAAKWGLELNGLAALDKENHTAYHLEAFQTVNLKKNESLVDFYARQILDKKTTLLGLSPYLVADAYFSKSNFVNPLKNHGFHLISRLRKDADLRYLYICENLSGKRKRGRSKQYDGKIKYQEIDSSKLEWVCELENEEILTGVVYAKSLKICIKLVIVYTQNSKGQWSHQLYFSTDTQQDWKEILELYRLRFQIEFLYRDAKQFTGLTDGQSRSINKMNFHSNMSLTAINLVKMAHWIPISKELRGPFSMSDFKTLYHNDLMLQKFLITFGINPNSPKNKHRIASLRQWGRLAA